MKAIHWDKLWYDFPVFIVSYYGEQAVSFENVDLPESLPTRFAVVKTDFPNFYTPPHFAVVKTYSPNFYKPYTRFAVV